MSMIYRDWGFRGNPFQQTPLPPTEEGAKLLVGRAEELTMVITRLASPPSIVTIEGRNGIGKTSIVNVAAYTAYQEYLRGVSLPLLIPCINAFQLEPQQPLESFLNKVYLAVAQTLIQRASDLKTLGYSSSANLGALDRWLNSPILTTLQGGFNWKVLGLQGGKGESTNDSVGFAASGFLNLVDTLLAEIFADGEAGGLVCTIDNLELLRSSDIAREQVEALRDRILTKTGLRWVLCGSTGIVRGVASTSRLSGVLYDPVEVGDVNASYAGQIFQSRVECFAVKEGETYLPLTEQEFHELFDILNNNIRDTLNYCNNYCMMAFEKKLHPESASEKRLVFRDWIKAEAEKTLKAASRIVKVTAWELFDKILKDGGECSPGDNKAYGFKTPQAMRTHVIKLENASLIQSVRDDDDNRRKTIAVTPKGWLVDCSRRNSFGTLFEKE